LARHRFALFVLAAVALTSSFWLLLDVVAAYTRSGETFGVVNFETRFDPLRKALPPRSVVGYVSDNPITDPSALGEYYLTQYTLVPAIVKASTEEALVVANFHNDKPNLAVLQAKNLVHVQTFPNDLHFYHNTNK
jgi:hypothetical protein